METLKFKVPLKIYMKVNTAFGNGFVAKRLDELDLSEVRGTDILLGQYNWLTNDGESSERDKICMGFDGTEITMKVKYEDGCYILDVVSILPLDKEITISSIKTTIPLKNAIINALNGQLYDGIGKNEIGHIIYKEHVYNVWLDNLIEL